MEPLQSAWATSLNRHQSCNRLQHCLFCHLECLEHHFDGSSSQYLSVCLGTTGSGSSSLSSCNDREFKSSSNFIAIPIMVTGFDNSTREWEDGIRMGGCVLKCPCCQDFGSTNGTHFPNYGVNCGCIDVSNYCSGICLRKYDTCGGHSASCLASHGKEVLEEWGCTNSEQWIGPFGDVNTNANGNTVVDASSNDGTESHNVDATKTLPQMKYEPSNQSLDLEIGQSSFNRSRGFEMKNKALKDIEMKKADFIDKAKDSTMCKREFDGNLEEREEISTHSTNLDDVCCSKSKKTKNVPCTFKTTELVSTNLKKKADDKLLKKWSLAEEDFSQRVSEDGDAVCRESQLLRIERNQCVEVCNDSSNDGTLGHISLCPGRSLSNESLSQDVSSFDSSASYSLHNREDGKFNVDVNEDFKNDYSDDDGNTSKELSYSESDYEIDDTELQSATVTVSMSKTGDKLASVRKRRAGQRCVKRNANPTPTVSEMSFRGDAQSVVVKVKERGVASPPFHVAFGVNQEDWNLFYLSLLKLFLWVCFGVYIVYTEHKKLMDG